MVGRLLLTHILNTKTNSIETASSASPDCIAHFDYDQSLIMDEPTTTPPVSPEPNDIQSLPVTQTKSILAEMFVIITNYSMKFKDLPKADPIRISLIGLIVLLITASGPLKYNHLAEFLDVYPEFHGIDQYELIRLMQNANLMAAAVTVLVPSQNKGIIMNIVPRLTEGPHVRYITGGGSSKATSDRVVLFEREGNTTIKKRSTSFKKHKKKTKEAAIPSYLTLSSFSYNGNIFNKSSSFDEDDMVASSVNSDISSNYRLVSPSISSTSSCSTSSRANSIDMSQLYGSIPFLINISNIHWQEDEIDIDKDDWDVDYDSKRQKICNESLLDNNDASSWDILVNVAKTFL